MLAQLPAKEIQKALLCNLAMGQYDIKWDNVILEQKWLAENVGRSFSEVRLAQVRDFAQPLDIATLAQIATVAAERQVKPEHFPAGFDAVWQPSAGTSS